MSDTPDELLRLAIHESAHAIAHWHFRDEIVGVTLNDHEGGGAVFGRGYSNTLIGARQQMAVTAAGAAAEGKEPTGPDAARIASLARQICGMAANPQALQEEIDRAIVAARWLTQEYHAEIAEVARKLVDFHQYLESVERRYETSID
ncbi:MAG: hypothetical protein WCB27_13670 [Thermoguttaceae bacterium]